MGSSSAQLVVVDAVGLDLALLERLVAQRIDVERLGVELQLEVFTHATSRLTAVLVDLGSDLEAEAIDLAPAAKAIAKQLGKQAFSVVTFTGTEQWMRVAAFDARGQRWVDAGDDDATKRLTSIQRSLGGKPKRPNPRDLPYWRMAAALRSRPSRPLWALGLMGPTVELKAPWKKVSTKALRFSPGFVARQAAQTTRAELERRERDAAAALEHERAAREHAAWEAERRQEREAEARTLMNCNVALGAPREVQLPAKLVATAKALAAKHAVSDAWVFQAAAQRSTPWKFPATALPACPLVAPVPIALVVSPALEQALSKSSLLRPDGTTASFEELVRVAISVGLDDLKEDLKENERKRKKPREQQR